MYHSVTGVTELRDLYSKMIREGTIARAEALAKLEVEEKIPKAVIDDVLSSFDLDLEELNIHVNEDLISR